MGSREAAALKKLSVPLGDQGLLPVQCPKIMLRISGADRNTPAPSPFRHRQLCASNLAGAISSALSASLPGFPFRKRPESCQTGSLAQALSAVISMATEDERQSPGIEADDAGVVENARGSAPETTPCDEAPRGPSVPDHMFNPLYDFLQGIRDEILVKNRAEIDRANEKLFKDIKEVTVQLVAQIVSQASAGHTNSRGTKRLHPKTELIIPEVDLLVEDKTRFISPLLRSLILIVVACFTSKHTVLRGWLTNNAYHSLTSYANILPRVSGFSTIWFSKVSSDTKGRFRTDIGKIWTCAIRAAMVSTVLSMRQEFVFEAEVSSEYVPGTTTGGASGNTTPPPQWLSELADCVHAGRSPGANLTAIVHKVVGEEEDVRARCTVSADGESELSGIGTGSRQKRRRTWDGVEDQKANHEILLKRLYSAMRSYLGGTRTTCRLVLFSDLLFLTQKIKSAFPNESAASAAGYRIVFQKKASLSEDSSNLEGTKEGSIWNIGNARVSGGSQQSRIEFNESAFQAMQAAFPSLSLSLQYRRKVVYTARDKVDEFSEEHLTPNLHWDYVEEVSLHDTARKLLMEVVRMKNADELLQISSFSLKAIHVTALALRGLVKQQLNQDLSEIESSALGGCVSTKLTKDSQFVAPLVGMAGMEPDKEYKSKQEQEWEKKFCTTWSSFKSAKREWVRMQRMQSSNAGQSRSRSSNSPISVPGVNIGADMSFNDKWMYCADEDGDSGEF